MAKQTITTGNSANDGSGDPARTAFTKTNNNFSEIYQYLGDGSTLNKLGSAAFKNVGTSAGNVMEVGAFGIGLSKAPDFAQIDKSRIVYLGFDPSTSQSPNSGIGSAGIHFPLFGWGYDLVGVLASTPELYMRTYNNNVGGVWAKFYSTANATVDSNGFVKSASPIVKLFSDRIQLNDEASEQEITFEKVSIGHYLVKGSSGFAQNGWYIETPKDANGNILFAVNYQQLENGDINVKTYKKKFDIETASIIADLQNPVDITDGRWIDIRLQEIPKPVQDMPTEEVNSDEPQQ